MASQGPRCNKVPQGLFFSYTVPLMAIPLSPCVSVSFYVLFSPPPLYPPNLLSFFFSPKSQTRSTNSPSHFSSISHLLSLRLSWGTVYIRARQRPAPLVAMATSLITASSVFLLSASFFPPSSCPLFLVLSITLPSISPSFGGASLNLKWARWSHFR